MQQFACGELGRRACKTIASLRTSFFDFFDLALEVQRNGLFLWPFHSSHTASPAKLVGHLTPRFSDGFTA